MKVEIFGVRYAPLKGPEWVLVGVAIVTVAFAAWEIWEKRSGNDRPVVRIAAAILYSFLGGISVDQGISLFRVHASSYRWTFQLFMGLLCVAFSIHNMIRRKTPKSVIEWLNERNKPPMIFEKKDD